MGPGFESLKVHQGPAGTLVCSGGSSNSQRWHTNGPLVKWSRRRPLTPQTGVRLSYGSPLKSKFHISCFRINAKTHSFHCFFVILMKQLCLVSFGLRQRTRKLHLTRSVKSRYNTYCWEKTVRREKKRRCFLCSLSFQEKVVGVD